MHRILLEIGPITIYSYGFFVALAYLAAISSGLYFGKRDGIDMEKAMDLCLHIMIAAVLGGRLLYVIAFWDNFSKNWLEIFMFWHGGFVFFGGLIAGISVTLWYVLKNKMPFWKVLDAAAIGTTLGLSIGRIGCFFNGCCYGKETCVPWAVKFPMLEGLRHPTQLYSSMYAFVIFLILWFAWKHRKKDGDVFVLGMFLYSICRFLVEFLRVEPRFWIFSGSQWISVGFFLTAIILYIRRTRVSGSK